MKAGRIVASVLLALVVLGVVGDPARAQRPANAGDAEKASLWMKQKLVASQKVLEGMTRGDFDAIEKNAQQMLVLAYLEEWFRADLPEYKAQLHAFDHANGAIVRAARERNIDGVTLAYNQLTISCVQCHKIVRDQKPSDK